MMLYSIDLSILYFINVTLSAAWLDSAMIYLTNVQHWVPVYVVGFSLLIYKLRWKGVRITLACLLLVGVSDLLTNRIIKEVVARPRPCSLISTSGGKYSWIRTPDGARNGFGFPSSHAVNNFVVVLFFTTLFPRKKLVRWLFLPATIVALSRVYLGLHYPSDVLGGMIIGAILGIGAALVTKKFENKFFSPQSFTK